MAQPQGEDVDQAFLTGLLDTYLDGLAKRDPGLLPLAPACKFTENGQVLPLGAGLFATATTESPYTRFLHVVDEGASQAASFNVAAESGYPVHLAVRLKVEDRLVSEIETLAVRERDFDFETEALLAERPGIETLSSLLAPLAPGERVSRAELVAVADGYFDGVMEDDGDRIAVEDACVRFEDGLQTTAHPSSSAPPLYQMSVAEQMSSGRWGDITDTRRRRYLALDEVRGLVFVWVFFDQVGLIASVEVKGIGRLELPRAERRPGSGMMAEIFKIRNGKISHIEALFDFFPYMMGSGWE